ncbi:MAG: PAP2 superfamily [Marinobacter excellens HL-55]|uniref:PAP2 superfamily n=1 Tax=Marinobacter excellens HL-55 TaxID=1305731 RepID=A0A0P8D2Y4_9GAMM|nr:MAG: PAP2 superfamily [Marinobacter excellens HL-55]
MVWLKAFIAGLLATLIFHQGLFAVFYLLDAVPAAPYNMTPVPPLGIPSVLSLAFFGGLWGIALWAVAGRLLGAWYWLVHIALGAIGPTAVAMLVVFPMKDLAVSAQTWVGGLILNGFWGLGVAVFMVLMAARAKR